jgi:hypothetical protein
VIDHVASVNGVPPRVPETIPPVAVYVRVDASAADGAASMEANAISPTESVVNEMRIMIVSLAMRRRALPRCPLFLLPALTVSNNWSITKKCP